MSASLTTMNKSQIPSPHKDRQGSSVGTLRRAGLSDPRVPRPGPPAAKRASETKCCDCHPHAQPALPRTTTSHQRATPPTPPATPTPHALLSLWEGLFQHAPKSRILPCRAPPGCTLARARPQTHQGLGPMSCPRMPMGNQASMATLLMMWHLQSMAHCPLAGFNIRTRLRASPTTITPTRTPPRQTSRHPGRHAKLLPSRSMARPQTVRRAHLPSRRVNRVRHLLQQDSSMHRTMRIRTHRGVMRILTFNKAIRVPLRRTHSGVTQILRCN